MKVKKGDKVLMPNGREGTVEKVERWDARKGYSVTGLVASIRPDGSTNWGTSAIRTKVLRPAPTQEEEPEKREER